MTGSDEALYEVTFFVEGDVAARFDAWLADTLQQAPLPEAISDRRVIERPASDTGAEVRILQYLLVDDRTIDDLLDSGAIVADRDVDAVFDGEVAIETRLLREDRSYESLPGDAPTHCLNCSTRLRGQYCGTCGQRARSRLISLWELVADAFGDLFEVDSRLWRTLVPLVRKPGQLTHDYLQGRRARFMPPFRMYLVLSLVFFLIAFTNPREKFGILFEAPGDETAESAAPAEDTSPTAAAGPGNTADELRNEILNELIAEGVIAADDIPAQRIPDTPAVESDDDDGEGPVSVRCNVDPDDIEDLPGFLQRRLTPERLQQVCERLQLDNGRAFLREMIGTIPTALIVLLPVMAVFLKMLYPLSRRYYVEHLLFFVHFHAFFFLILTLQVLYTRAGNLVGLPDWAIALPNVLAGLYVPVYLFISMRRVYGQGRVATFLKYAVLLALYFMGFSVTLGIVALLTAFSL